MTTSGERHAQLGALQRAGRFDEAERLCRDILRDDPADVDVLAQLGRMLGQRGDLDAAEEALRRAVRLRGDSAELARQLRGVLAAKDYRLGLLLARQQRNEEAMTCIRRALEHAPDFPDAQRALGILLAAAGRFAEATDSFRRALALRPDSAQLVYNLGLSLQNQQQFVEAEAHYRKALELNPAYAHAHNNLAIVLAEQGRFSEAEAAYRRAAECAPDYIDAHYNLADLLVKQNRAAEAEACCRRALPLDADVAGAHYKLAVALAAQNRLAAAAAGYRKVIEVDSGHVDAHVGLASMLLLGGNFTEGWPQYEWRLKHDDMPPATFAQPRWQGESLAGRTILLRAEQGAGDTIQFIRYAELVKQRGGTVIAEHKANLARLLATCAGVDSVVVAGEPRGDFDVVAPLPSLPGIFGTTPESIPARVPYLFPDESAVAAWRDELGPAAGLRIGIAWQGNPAQRQDRVRSIPLEAFAPLARVAGVQLISLQFGAGREQLARVAGDLPLVDLGDRLGDFHHTAALMRNLDLVISCDSAPAHLAGALGVPVFLALAFAPDWRWLLERSDSPWYPTMRLFRQPRAGDWAGAFRPIEEAVMRLAAARANRGPTGTGHER